MNIQVSRRGFLKSAALFSAIGVAPSFLTRVAEAQGAPIEGFKDDRILVVVQLGGGNDGLNTVVPYGDDTYYRVRPNLGLKGNRILKVNDYIALNDQLEGLMRLYDDGQLAAIHGVGYPNPERSHFRSMEIWQTASDSDEYLGTGWIGRYFDNCCSGQGRPQAGVALSQERPQAFRGKRGFGIALEHPELYGWQEGLGMDREATFQQLNTGKTSNGTLDFLRHTTSHAIMSSQEVRKAAEASNVRAHNNKPLQVVAGLIRGGLDTRIYYVPFGGFDTHANQLGRQDGLLKHFADSMHDFQATLKRDGTADRVVTMVFSEFGRRVKENASGGTDHGTAAPMFLIGEKVKPGFHGKFPSLTDLDQGDLKHTADFRSVYATVLDRWFGIDAKPVLQGEFPPLDLMA